MNRNQRAGLASVICVCVIGVVGGMVSASAGGMAGGPLSQAAADTGGNKHDCIPMWLETTDYFIDVVSTLPNHSGLPAQVEIRRVRPIYHTGRCRNLVRSAVLVHGRTIDGISAFDVPYGDYSLMTSMANNGIDAFAFNQLGFGASSHFSMDDPCNASRSTDAAVNVNPTNQQNVLLVPNPLQAECLHSDNSHFTDRQAGIDQLDAVVKHVLSLSHGGAEEEGEDGTAAGRRRATGRDRDHSERPDRVAREPNPHTRRRVSLFSWSLGSTVVGPYLAVPRNQANIARVVMLAGPFGTTPALTQLEPPPGVGRATWPLGVGNFAGVSALVQVNAACPGQRSVDVLHAVWDSMRSRDPYAAGWGSNQDPVTGGLSRWPTAVRWGWGPTEAAAITVPVLVIGGLIDQTVPAAHLDALYGALSSSQKVRVRIDCASHASLWEGSAAASGWGGPHTTIQAAVIEWLTNGTYQGFSIGQFRTLADGTTMIE
jgi:pimeloyl-ACP methyl ester carboxylesterase